jgi:hypothetical protein
LAPQLSLHHQNANGIQLADHDLKPGHIADYVGRDLVSTSPLEARRDAEFGRTPERADRFLMPLVKPQAVSTVCAAGASRLTKSDLFYAKCEADFGRWRAGSNLAASSGSSANDFCDATLSPPPMTFDLWSSGALTTTAVDDVSESSNVGLLRLFRSLQIPSHARAHETLTDV